LNSFTPNDLRPNVVDHVDQNVRNAWKSQAKLRVVEIGGVGDRNGPANSGATCFTIPVPFRILCVPSNGAHP